ncbi:tRNA (adenosine(37)-N6)-threonylcarbamoyltransferase complex dimerization subunit type 1 TsaB [[Clostridium] polysaccharolyticum]|uniref:tRNA threonylcarbamoyl adenosine modification protein YeaZ n=1 Tax=[Clostridium] polysaccharolyticum TaxID=29364 RepID=A0A1I0FEN7_9FIRM|nr:tRNA (adenosine(37)-N6)-threonylcarbamoyltransferase complex dimerization subunit type 1 TsaB [[Clostridium] polysaccharolyticum]SET55838.1 tRNA threonylcarbamoyl adenosine modification protein YeaZ [[Clostridium] polysaccharolyticum]
MNILAIDSSGLVASVAILRDDVLAGEYTINYKKTHSQTLLPMLDEVVKMIEFDLNSLDAIAVAAGPGSFTGLRIGSATAKGLGLALGKPVISVSTVEGLAFNLYRVKGVICPIMDARRNQVYTGVYKYEENDMVTVMEPCAISIDELIGQLEKLDENVVFTGDGIPVFEEVLREKLGEKCSFVPAHFARQRAGAIAALGVKYFKEGKTESAAEHKPIYLRLSQAERELQEKQSKQAKE